MRRAVIWDFDGTLAHRPGLWSGCLLEILDEHVPGHRVHHDQIRALLRDGFPWHQPEVEHPELCAPEAWWRQVEDLLSRAYRGVGIESQRASELARHARERFIDAAYGWRLFDDTLTALRDLRAAGWRHVILSNHVPELPELTSALGLSGVIDIVLTSAITGYEKPHPKMFALALEACDHPDQVWMVGDNPIADVGGAQAAGIPAIQVRTRRGGAERYAKDVVGAAAIIRTGEAPLAAASNCSVEPIDAASAD